MLTEATKRDAKFIVPPVMVLHYISVTVNTSELKSCVSVH